MARLFPERLAVFSESTTAGAHRSFYLQIRVVVALILLMGSPLFQVQAGGPPGGGPPPSGGSPPVSAPTTSAPSSTPLSLIDYACLHNDTWLVNTNGHRNLNFGTKTDILWSRYSNSTNRWKVRNPTIPNYDQVFTVAEIHKLDTRPRLSYDFANEKNSTAKVGKKYAFGDNIGYVTDGGCNLGYWPPGPVCPSTQNTTMTYTLTPAEEATPGGCYYTAHSTYAYTINGVALFYWGDATSYDSKGTWNNLAITFEYYDLDICLGHAASGVYHHHSYSPCLAKILGDNGTDGHSPVHAWAPDGYPIYGPYQDTGILAESCWQKRDYSAGSATGCGTAHGHRTCLLVDQWDYTKGVTKLTASSYGPNITTLYTSQSGNLINATSGAYFEDHYFNSSCYEQGSQYLNENNGHAHDGLGFHYHMTIDSTGLPIFPYALGPKLYGCVSTGECATSYIVPAMGPGTSSGPPPMLTSTSSSSSTCGISLGTPSRKSKCLPSSAKNLASVPTKSPTASTSSSTSSPTAGTVISLVMNVTQTLSGFSAHTRNLTLSQRRTLQYATVSSLSSKGMSVSNLNIYRVSTSASSSSSSLRRLLLGSTSTLYVSYGFTTSIPYAYVSSVSFNVTDAVSLMTVSVQNAVSGPTFLAILEANDSATFGHVTVTSVSVTSKTTSVSVTTSSPTESPPLPMMMPPINLGAVIGGAVGGFVGLLLIAAGLYYYFTRVRRCSAVPCGGSPECEESESSRQIIQGSNPAGNRADAAAAAVQSGKGSGDDGDGVMMQPMPIANSGPPHSGPHTGGPVVATPVDYKGRY